MHPAMGTPDRLAGFPFSKFKLGENKMLAKYIAAGLAGSAMFASVAFAQTPTTNADRASTAPAAKSDSSTFQGDWRTSKVVGLDVYNDSNESIGSINDLLTDKSGNIKAAVISVGGFLGVGSHLVAVPFDKVKFVNEPVASGTASTSPAGSKASSTTTGAAGTDMAKTNSWYPNHAVFNATKDQLKAMPEFKFSS
jgi:sporulation protein YlmC with PRC-barrel domain